VKLSIIIPLYNQEYLIIKALESIKAGFDIETIVIDDGSSDNSFNVVLDYIENHPEKNIILLFF
jgi:glycosyltransferase involved in cell wall biosynthesis